MPSFMLSEAREAPALAERALQEDGALYAALGRALRDRPPPFAATVARGSSDHAATYAAYLFGIAAGRVTATLAPSIVTRHGVTRHGVSGHGVTGHGVSGHGVSGHGVSGHGVTGQGAGLHMRGALALALSQSGSSPDLVRTLGEARRAGAVTAAIVNAEASPLAAEAEWALPQRAGPERAVAATKSFVMTLLAVARLTAAWSEDAGLAAALPRLPGRLDDALRCDWSAHLPVLAGPGCFVIARGPALAVAQEAALKLKETSHLHAEAISAAELQHGPRAVVDGRFPVLAFALDDPGGADTRAAVAELGAAGAPVLLAAPGGLLPAPLHKLLDPIPAVLAFYPFAEALARARGLDPDRPRGLRKVTETL